jgi:hypothetical protein
MVSKIMLLRALKGLLETGLLWVMGSVLLVWYPEPWSSEGQVTTVLCFQGC